jgi:hypothetical protein
MTYSIPDRILDKSDALAREGRIIGGQWRRQDGAIEMVCALASWENGGKINSVADCPTSYAPGWLLELIPKLDDGLADDAASGRFVLDLNARARRWSSLDDAAWERVRVGFLTTCITRALEAAEKAQPAPRPDYWDKVQGACGQVLAALEGKETAEAAETARAAAGAADAARAAEAAGETARAAAYQGLIDALLALLDAAMEKA